LTPQRGSERFSPRGVAEPRRTTLARVAGQRDAPPATADAPARQAQRATARRPGSGARDGRVAPPGHGPPA